MSLIPSFCCCGVTTSSSYAISAITADVLADGNALPLCCCDDVGPIIIGLAPTISSPSIINLSPIVGSSGSADNSSFKSVSRWTDIIATTACIAAMIFEFPSDSAPESVSVLTGVISLTSESGSVSAATTPPNNAANNISWVVWLPFFARGWAVLELFPAFAFDAISDIRF